MILLGLVLVTALLLIAHQYYAPASAIRFALFQAVSIATTTGFTVTDYSAWPSVLPFLLLYASFAGACAGSTGGGMKIIRVLLVFKQGVREIKRRSEERRVGKECRSRS